MCKDKQIIFVLIALLYYQITLPLHENLNKDEITVYDETE